MLNGQHTFFILDASRAETQPITPKSNLTISGYNLKDCEVLLIPDYKGRIEGKEAVSKKYLSALHPFPDSLEEKPDSIIGYPLNIVKQTDNKIIVDFNDILKFSGAFDIAVVNGVDYDLLSERKGFKLRTV